MKIAMIAYGQSLHAQRPLKWILEDGHEVLFIDTFNPFPEGKRGYKFLRIYNYPYLLSFLRLFSYELTYQLRKIISYRNLVKSLNTFNPDVIHVHYLDDRARFVSEFISRPLVISIWGTDVNACFLKHNLTEECTKKGIALKKADKIIIDDFTIANKCQKLANANLSTEYLHLGLNIHFFKKNHSAEIKLWRAKLDIDPDTIVILSPRIWEKKYSHIEILIAFSKAVKHFKKKKIVIIFKKAFAYNLKAKIYENKFTRLIYKLKIHEFVRFIDQVDFQDIPPLYKLSDLVINFPRHDAFPVTFAETAICETPVITCMLPAYKNTFAENYFRTIDPGDIKALEETIVDEIQNLGSPSQLYRMEQAAKEAEKLFDENIYRENIISIYRDLIK